MEEAIRKENLETGINVLRLKPPRIAVMFLLIAIGSHFLLHNYARWHFGCVVCGVATVVLGFLLMMWAWWLFRTHETAICPTAEATILVDRGPFRVSRNPMYSGMTVMLAGCAWIFGTMPVFFAPIAFFLVMNNVFIPFEERCRVRRWV